MSSSVLLLILFAILAMSRPRRGSNRRRAGRRAIVRDRFVRSRRKPAWVRREVVRIAGRCPSDTGCRTIALQFNRRFAIARDMTVDKSFVAGVLRDHRAEVSGLRLRFHNRVPPPLPINLVWGVDMTGKGDRTGAIHSILGVLDHGSRKLLTLRVIARRTSWTLLGHLCLAIAEHGRPRAIRTDNDSVFTSRVFRSMLALMGVRHQRTISGCPWQNGRIERLFGTLKARLDLWSVASAEELAYTLTSFEVWYNIIRPHQHLGGRTPAEAWSGVDPFAVAPRQATWFEAWDGLLVGYHIRR